MHLYLSRWESYDDGVPGVTTFRPVLRPWLGGLLDLRPDVTVEDGWCLLEVDERPETDPPGVIYIGDNWDTQLGSGLTGELESVLGRSSNRWSQLSIRDIIVDVIPSHPRRDGRSVVHCGKTVVRNEQTHGPRPASVTHTETWPTDGTLTADNQDLDYTSLDEGSLASAEVSNGTCGVEPTTNLNYEYRAEHDTDTDDSFAETTVLSVTGTNATAHVGCRGSASARTFYLIRVRGSNSRVQRSVNGSRTDLTSDIATGGFPTSIRIEADGDQISAVAGDAEHGPVTDTNITTGKRGTIGGIRSWFIEGWAFGDLAEPPPTTPSGSGPVSAIGLIDGDGNAPTIIPAPENVQVVFTGATEAKVTWDAVDGAEIYQVEARVRSGIQEE